MKSNKNVIGVDAVNKALEILNCFTEKNEALTITKIANITGDHKSRISRISKSLENFGYIRKIKSGEFKIGHTIPRLFEIYESSFNLKNSIKTELDFISSKTMETASFFVRQNDVRVCIQSSSPNKSIRHQEVIGDKKPINKGSSGHVLSAYNNLEIKDKDDILKNGLSNSRHIWLWDDISTRKVLSDIGFINIERKNYMDSGINGFDTIEKEGSFNNAFCLECTK